MSEEKSKKPSKKKYYDNVSVGKRTKQVVYLAGEHDKATMFAHFLKNSDKKQTVVVAISKRRADELSEYLKSQGITAEAIHGNTKKEEYEATAKAFKTGVLNILITTDVILQLLELTNIKTIINYDLPPQHVDYFNRLILVDGVGESISFVSPQEEGFLSIIEMRLKNVIPQEELEGFVATDADEVAHATKEKKKKPRHRTLLVKKVKKKKKEEESRD